MIKRYIALNNLHLSTTIMVDNKQYSILFKGGTLKPIRKNGQFVTDNEKIQKALENDNGYGVSFIELKDGNATTPVVKTVKRGRKSKSEQLKV